MKVIFTVLIMANLFGQATLVQSNFTGILVPQYCIGHNNRLPHVFRAQVTNLTPNTTYRYYCRVALMSDFGSTFSGAGNSLLMNHVTSTFTYTTNPNVNTTGNYETFTTDATGNYTGWFCFVTSGDSRFTAGNIVYPMIVLANNSGTILHRRALDLGIRVLRFYNGYGVDSATGICGNTGAMSKNIIALYDNVNATGRPLSVTYVENDDTTFSNVGYYTSNVNGINGAWGTIIPNANINGVRRIDQYSLNDASLVSSITEPDGVWGCLSTVTPTGGSGGALNMTNYVRTVNTIFSNPPTSYYRSKNSGEFCDVNSWEASIDGTNWINACKVPDKDDNTIVIRDSHSIQIADTRDTLWLDETAVSSNAILTLRNGALNINNGMGSPDFVIQGTFKDSSTKAAVFAPGATWELASGANFIKSAQGNPDPWRDNYEGTMASIPANSNWYIRRESPNRYPVFASEGGAYYGNLIFENYLPDNWNTTGLSCFCGSGVPAVIKGNLDVGGSGLSTLRLNYNNTSAGNYILVMGNVVVQSGDTLRNRGTGINLKGNLIVHGAVTYGNTGDREWSFTGSTNQNISGNGSLSIFRLRSDKPSGDLIFNRNVSVYNTLHLVNGKIDLNKNTLYIDNPSGAAVVRTNGWVESEDPDNSSKIEWRINNNTSSREFPFGKNSTTYIPLIFKLNTGNVGNVIVSTYSTGVDNTPYPVTPVLVTNLLNGSSDNSANVVDRFWQIDRTGTSAFNATITFTYDDAEEPSDEAILNAQRYEASTNQWQPYLPGQTENASLNRVTVPGVTMFSPWTLSKTSSPLPVQLLSFNASTDMQGVLLRWSVAPSDKIQKFYVQKSYDNLFFYNIHSITYTGSPHYEYTDHIYSGETVYYRIKIVENNDTSYSDVKVINSHELSGIIVFPVPFSDKLNIKIPDPEETDISLALSTLDGKDIMHAKTYSKSLYEISTHDLPNGLYFLKVTLGDRIYNFKLIK
ncbi:MAG: T9SS type A sorting domain-containing protein [Cytophagaceae bacterium]|nr:T9SS type A sorting domain-containing protein [Cytophagaceae bacterium]MDW8456110.1 T9SS type A sorting domain-containing protein [Cytophagaceae bacterium]